MTSVEYDPAAPDDGLERRRIRLGDVVRPATVIVNKATLEGDVLPRFTWGAAQLGVAQGVLDAVADGIVDAGEAAELVLLVPVWVDSAATDETAVRLAHREATRAAIEDAVRPPTADEVRALVARRDQASNAFYGGE